MKRVKFIGFMFLFLILVCPTVCFAGAPSEELPAVCSSNYAFTDAEGLKVTALQPGGSLKVCTVVTTESARDISLVLALYQGNVMKDVSVDRKTIDGSMSMEAIISTLPDIIDDCTVKVLFWDSVTLQPLGEAVQFPSGDADIAAITIGGNPVVGFNPGQTEYNLVVNTESGVNTAVKTVNMGASYAIDYPDQLPGTVSVNVTSSGGATKVYRLNCSVASPQLMNLTAKTGSSYQIDYDAAVGDLMYSDRTLKITEMSTEFNGMTHLLTANSDKNNSLATNSTVTDFITFDLPMSADIYTCGYIGGPWLASDGFVKQTGLHLRREDGAGYVDYDNNIYKRHIDVAPGQTVHVSLGSPGYASIGQMYVVFIKWTYPIVGVSSANAMQDTFVRSGEAAHGGDSVMTVKYDYASPDRSAGSTRFGYVKFDLSPWQNKKVKIAKLRLYAGTTTAGTIMEVAKTSDAWDENMVWNNKPELGEVIGAAALTAASSWVEIDVSQYVDDEVSGGDGQVSFALAVPTELYTDSAYNAQCSVASRESGNKPQLIVQEVSDWYSSSDTELAGLYIRGASAASFSPSIYNYQVTLPQDCNFPPYVFASAKGGTFVNTIIQKSSSIPGSAVIRVSTKDGAKTTTYTVNYSRPDNAEHIYYEYAAEDCHVKADTSANQHNSDGEPASMMIKKDTEADGGSTSWGYLKFKIPVEDAAKLTSAKLVLFGKYANTGYLNGNLECYKADDNWNENTITWANKPEPETAVIGTAAYSPSWYKILVLDVTEAVRTECSGDKEITLVLKSGTESVNNAAWSIYSRSNETFKQPHLILKFAQ